MKRLMRLQCPLGVFTYFANAASQQLSLEFNEGWRTVRCN